MERFKWQGVLHVGKPFVGLEGQRRHSKPHKPVDVAWGNMDSRGKPFVQLDHVQFTIDVRAPVSAFKVEQDVVHLHGGSVEQCRTGQCGQRQLRLASDDEMHHHFFSSVWWFALQNTRFEWEWGWGVEN